MWANLSLIVGIRLVAAGGNVEIVDLEPGRLAAERHGDVARIALGAEIAPARLGEREARDDGDAVVALLAVERDVLVAELAELAARKLPVGAFRLLQAEHVRLVLAEKARDEVDAQPHRIDVPGGEGEMQMSVRS